VRGEESARSSGTSKWLEQIRTSTPSLSNHSLWHGAGCRSTTSSNDVNLIPMLPKAKILIVEHATLSQPLTIVINDCNAMSLSTLETQDT
jgi:hypothetical protein